MKRLLTPLGAGLVLVVAYACNSGESVFSDGGVLAGSGGDTSSGGAGTGNDGPGGSVAVTVGQGAGPGSGGAGGVGQGGAPVGAGGAAQGGAPGTLECFLPNWCDEPNLEKCSCTGCNPQNPQCTQGEDCVCPDCQGKDGCEGCTMGGPNGFCNPYYEGCGCEDCANHPLCLKD